LTGDLVDGSVRQYRAAAAPLADLRARHGVYAVTGNHEYYHGADPWIAELTRLGVRYLRNERVTIERDGAAFELAGVDDHNARGTGHRADVGRAATGRDAAVPLVLLAHQPRQVHAAARHGVDLQLSGHTHGGQIWPWHYAVMLQQGGLLAGHYRIKATQLYVTRGCGFWGPRVRLGAPLEITRVILRA
jgi:predicted MPP superfamily phosphohydrolase